MSDCSKTPENKPRILLWSLEYAGLIILYPSGVIYQNQTDGLYCWQDCEEGVFVPLFDIALPNENRETQLGLLHEELAKFFSGGMQMSARIADSIDVLLQNYVPLRGIKIDRVRLYESKEAWVYVKCISLDKTDYSGFGDSFNAVLTWPNSD
ncbi:MAG: hypothetical protein HY862_00205 [Chloroflexi bacterium]|nr:hypothetical protein [Chloroflexota bacterium]